MKRTEAGKASAVILAGGTGTRASGGEAAPKQFWKLAGKPMLAHSLETFQSCEKIMEITIVAPAEHIERAREIAGDFSINKATVTAGGATRFESARRGFEQTSADSKVVVFHDAARPFATAECVSRTISDAMIFGAATNATPLDDSIKKTRILKTGEQRQILRSVDRTEVCRVQTPQAFLRPLLADIYGSFSGDPEEITDESVLFEKAGKEVVVSGGSRLNMKITSTEDFIIAGCIADGIKNGAFRETEFSR